MNYLKFILATFVLASLPFCKDNSNYQDKEIRLLQQTLSSMISENERMIHIIEMKFNGNRSAEPYLHISKKLNGFINSVVDTTFSRITSDTLVIKNSLNVINKKYRDIIDSMSRRYERGLFLTSDDSLLRLPLCDYPGYFRDPVINHFILTQRLLNRHLNVLTILRESIGEVHIRFFSIEKAGYVVNSLQNGQDTRVRLHYNFPKWYADYRLIRFEGLKDQTGGKVAMKELKVLPGDTIAFTMLRTGQGTYKAAATYSLLTPDGDKYERTIDFPFNLW